MGELDSSLIIYSLWGRPSAHPLALILPHRFCFRYIRYFEGLVKHIFVDGVGFIHLYYTVTKINSILRGNQPKHGMSPQTLITGNRLILPPFTIGDYDHGIPGGTSNDTDKCRRFGAGIGYTILHLKGGTRYQGVKGYQCLKVS